MKSGTWLQRLWWETRDLYEQLKPCRFSIGVAIVGLLVFTLVAQGVEVLRTVGEGVAAGSQWYALRVVFFFVDLWPPDAQKWVPALFLNGTSVEKGNRIMTSNLRVTDSFFDVEDAAVKLGPPEEGATKVACHIPLSTAAHMSARFTYVSPAGRFPDETYIVDGGYFENSGATKALEIVARINEWCAFNHIADVDPKVIMISNNPRRPPIAPAKPGPEKSGPALTQPETVHGLLLGEVMSPVKTMLNARDARGTFAQRAIAHQQRRFKAAGEAPPSKDQPESLSPAIFYFSLEDKDVPLPLGWMLSDAAAKSIRGQWNFDRVIVRNKTAAEKISRTLPSTTP